MSLVKRAISAFHGPLSERSSIPEMKFSHTGIPPVGRGKNFSLIISSQIVKWHSLTIIPFCADIGPNSEIDKQPSLARLLDKEGPVSVAREVILLPPFELMKVPEEIDLHHIQPIIHHFLQEEEVNRIAVTLIASSPGRALISEGLGMRLSLLELHTAGIAGLSIPNLLIISKW